MTRLLLTDDGPIRIDRTFVTQARRRAQNEAWMWRYHTATARPGWQQQANCKGMPPDWFYGQPGSSEKPLAKVLQVCTHCPVRLDCGAALIVEENNNDQNAIHGVRAGMNAKTRENLYVKMTALGFR